MSKLFDSRGNLCHSDLRTRKQHTIAHVKSRKCALHDTSLMGLQTIALKSQSPKFDNKVYWCQNGVSHQMQKNHCLNHRCLKIAHSCMFITCDLKYLIPNIS